MTQSTSPQQRQFNNGEDDKKELLSVKGNMQITDNDDEDILKNDASKDVANEKPLSVTELKDDMEDEDELNEEAETTGLL